MDYICILTRPIIKTTLLDVSHVSAFNSISNISWKYCFFIFTWSLKGQEKLITLRQDNAISVAAYVSLSLPECACVLHNSTNIVFTESMSFVPIDSLLTTHGHDMNLYQLFWKLINTKNELPYILTCITLRI